MDLSSSLRFPDGDDVFEIELEFLGKDSMLFKQTIDFKSYGTNGVKVFRNLEEFCRRKKPQEDVFDTLTVSTHPTNQPSIYGIMLLEAIKLAGCPCTHGPAARQAPAADGLMLTYCGGGL